MTIDKLKPLAGKLIVEYEERYKQAEKSTTFLLAEPKHQGTPNSGIVSAIGEGIEDLKVGDYVFFSAGDSPPAFKVDGVGYFCLEVENILAIGE
jgi:co-chaperonin GroES (HSP10)